MVASPLLTHCLRASAVAVVAYPPGKRVKILFVSQVNKGVEPYYFSKLLLVNTLNLAFVDCICNCMADTKVKLCTKNRFLPVGS